MKTIQLLAARKTFIKKTSKKTGKICFIFNVWTKKINNAMDSSQDTALQYLITIPSMYINLSRLPVNPMRRILYQAK